MDDKVHKIWIDEGFNDGHRDKCEETYNSCYVRLSDILQLIDQRIEEKYLKMKEHFKFPCEANDRIAGMISAQKDELESLKQALGERKRDETKKA